MDAAAEIGRNPVSNHHTQPEYGDEQADAGRDCRIRLGRPNSEARTGTGKYSFSLFSWPRAGLATLPGWSLLLLNAMTIHTIKGLSDPRWQAILLHVCTVDSASLECHSVSLRWPASIARIYYACRQLHAVSYLLFVSSHNCLCPLLFLWRWDFAFSFFRVILCTIAVFSMSVSWMIFFYISPRVAYDSWILTVE